jgi:hypothetical protein
MVNVTMKEREGCWYVRTHGIDFIMNLINMMRKTSIHRKVQLFMRLGFESLLFVMLTHHCEVLLLLLQQRVLNGIGGHQTLGSDKNRRDDRSRVY